ncbi:MAG: DHHA1 domain-containing protein [bacterium]
MKIGIYHKDCTDGTGAAAGLFKRFRYDIYLVPLNYDYNFYEVEELVEKLNPKVIYIVDFTLRKEDMEELLKKGYRIKVYDHHITAENILKSLKHYENLEYIYDKNKSGAMIVWCALSNTDKHKEMEYMRYIQDRDLWIWEYENTKYITLYLYQYVNRPEKFLDIMQNEKIEDIIDYGKKVAGFIESQKSMAITSMGYNEIDGIKFFNCNFEKSDIGNYLSKYYNEPVAIYHIDGEKVRISFRSVPYCRKGNALKWANHYGGGGHEHAAGAVISLRDFMRYMKQ